jgi:ubiquinone/menaquinone biosynthesis C-methylase UbiE
VSYYWEEVDKKRFGKSLKWFERRVFARVIGNRPIQSCLDVGGGAGHKFPVDCEDYTLVEMEPEAVAIFRDRYPGGHFIEGDFLTFNFEKKYDLILMIQLSTNAECIRKMVTKAYSLLRKDGLMLFTTTNKNSYKGLLYSKGYGYQEPYPALKKFLETLGASSISCYGYGWLPFRRDSDCFLIPLLKWIDIVLGKFVSLSPWLLIVVKK